MRNHWSFPAWARLFNDRDVIFVFANRGKDYVPWLQKKNYHPIEIVFLRNSAQICVIFVQWNAICEKKIVQTFFFALSIDIQYSNSNCLVAIANRKKSAFTVSYYFLFFIFDPWQIVCWSNIFILVFFLLFGSLRFSYLCASFFFILSPDWVVQTLLAREEERKRVSEWDKKAKRTEKSLV